MAFGCAGSSPAFRTNIDNEKLQERGFFYFLTIPGNPAHCPTRQVAQSKHEPLDALNNNAQTAR